MKRRKNTLALVILVSAITSSLFINMPTSYAYPTGQIAVELPQNASTVKSNFLLNFSFKIPILKSFVGFSVDPDEYAYFINPSNRTNGLFECYLFVRCEVDYTKKQVIDIVNGSSFEAFVNLFKQTTPVNVTYLGNGTYKGSILLQDVPSGNHTLEVWALATQNMMSFYGDFWAAYSETVSFIVDDSLVAEPPEVLILSPQNATYYIDSAIFEVITNKPPTQDRYILDGDILVDEAANATLLGLTVGAHNLTVNAWDIIDNTETSKTVSFYVTDATPVPQSPSMSPSLPSVRQITDIQLLAAIGVAIVAVALLLAAIWRKKYSKNKLKTI